MITSQLVNSPSVDQRRESSELSQRLALLDESLIALRNSDVDALFLAGRAHQDGQLFTLDSADRVYRDLIEDMGEGALTLTADGLVVYANRRFAEMLAVPLSQVIGAHVQTYFAPDTHEALTALLADVAKPKRGAALDLICADGHRVRALLSVSNLSIDGVPGALSMVATDVSMLASSASETQAQEALRKAIVDQQNSEERLRMTLAGLPAHVALLDPSGVIVFVNDAWKHFALDNGLTDAEFGVGFNYLQFCDSVIGVAAEDAYRAAASIRSVLGGNAQQTSVEYPCHSPTEERWFSMVVSPLRRDPLDTGTGGAVVMHINVSERKRSELLALAEQRLVSKVFEQSGEGLIITDAHGRIIKVNHAFTTICGYSEAEALGQNPNMLSSGRHDADFFHAMWLQLEQTGRWQGEVWNRRKDGTVYPQWLSLSCVLDGNGKVTHYIASFSDSTHRKEAEEKILRLAHFDQLTGLPNRTLLGDRATQALQMVQRNGAPMAVMFIDLDHFKNVNDSLGHRVGDLLLVGLAERFGTVIREQDTLSRTGGDEFVLILPGADVDGAARVANKLLQAASQPFQIEQHELNITPSIGIAIHPHDGLDFETLTKCADVAMYRSKQLGRNTFSFYTQELQALAARAVLLENALRRALERSQLQLHYQPQRSLKTGEIIGAEALLRWQHPELGWVSPAEFIPIAEKSGLIIAIGTWVLQTAVHQLKLWLDDGMPQMVMAVNLSAVQFRQAGLPEMVCRILDETGVAHNCLELELTESVAADNPRGAIEVMDKLHACGIRMSIDDFGTGYSSLSYLKRFKIHKLKIDQSFINGVTHDRDDQAIVTSIIGLARSLGMQTIAEGVETLEQMQYLAGEGCDEIQGYWLSRPLPPEKFRAFTSSV